MFSEFKIRLWMDGPRSGIIPDLVEQEVGNFYRTLYKLEKVFNDAPAAKKIASKVCIVFVWYQNTVVSNMSARDEGYY